MGRDHLDARDRYRHQHDVLRGPGQGGCWSESEIRSAPARGQPARRQPANGKPGGDQRERSGYRRGHGRRDDPVQRAHPESAFRPDDPRGRCLHRVRFSLRRGAVPRLGPRLRHPEPGPGRGLQHQPQRQQRRHLDVGRRARPSTSRDSSTSSPATAPPTWAPRAGPTAATASSSCAARATPCSSSTGSPRSTTRSSKRRTGTWARPARCSFPEPTW